jgi:DNA-binding CsgD family transcriptional regulator
MGVQRKRTIKPGKKRGRPRTGATQSDRIVGSEREQQAVAMRLEGKTLAEIGAVLGITPQGVYKAVERAIARRIDANIEATDELRTKMLTEILVTIDGLWKSRGDLQTIDRLVRLWDRQAKLAGLDAAIVLEHQGAGGGPIQISDVRARILGRLSEIAKRLEGDTDTPNATEHPKPVAG